MEQERKAKSGSNQIQAYGFSEFQQQKVINALGVRWVKPGISY